MKYTIVLMQDEEDPGIFNVEVPALQGCHTWGRNKAEACERAKEAIQGYLKMLKDLGEPIPVQVDAQDIEVQVA